MVAASSYMNSTSSSDSSSSRSDRDRGDARRRDSGRAHHPRRSALSQSGPSPARSLALQVLRSLREREAFAQEVIERLIDRSTLPQEERSFATLLVLGVVSYRGTLDEIIDRCLQSPEDIRPNVRDALQISTYEIVFLEKSAYAAVDQGVELVRSVAPKAAGLGNAVLRKIVKSSQEFPYGDPRTDLAAFSRLHGFPLWLMKLLITDLGPEVARDFARASNLPAPVFIGINAVRPYDRMGGGTNSRKHGPEDLNRFRHRRDHADNEEIHSADREVLRLLREAHDDPRSAHAGGISPDGCYQLQSGRTLLDGRVKRLLNNGHILVSDAASQAVASLALPDRQPRSFLEIGSGRGTKSILIQNQAFRRWGSQIKEYITVDNREFKTELLRDRVKRYGINVSEALTADATRLNEVLELRQFDAVLIDAPCTGLGTLRRHPEIRWRIQPETIERYASLGFQLLESAAPHVALGGRLTYSTCTVTRAENTSLIAEFLQSQAGSAFQLLPIEDHSAFTSVLTPGSPDAHFAVTMQRVDR